MKEKWRILMLIVGSKLCVLLLIFLAFSLFPFASSFHNANFLYPPHAKITLQTAYATWDAQHYLFLSEKGYAPNIPSNAFSPLFPFCIHLVNSIVKNSFISGLFVANVASLLAYYLFYELLCTRYGRDVAYKSLVLLLVFPTSFFFSLIYTESLFFLLCMLFFIGIQRKNLFLSVIAGLLLPLTRLIGVAIIVPSLAAYLFDIKAISLKDEVQKVGRVFLQKEALFLIAPIGGLCLLMAIMSLTTGDAFAQWNAQKQFISQYSLLSLINPRHFLQAFFTFPLSIHGFTNSLLDRLFFVGFLLTLPLLAKKVSKSFFVYAVVFGILPVLGGSFMSYTRYLLVVFPLFIALAQLFNEKKYQPLAFLFVYGCSLLQGLFIIMYALNYWVA